MAAKKKIASGVLDMTLNVLTRSQNEATVEVLVPALDSAHQAIQEGALRGLVQRKSLAGQRELLARWHKLTPRWKELIAERQGTLMIGMRSAVMGSDAALCEAACEAALLYQEYDLIPSLINTLEAADNPNNELAGRTLISLSQMLVDELNAPRDYRKRRDPQLVRTHVVASLEQSLGRYSRHQRKVILEAFLMLTPRDNATLRRLLQDPLDKLFLPLIDLLTHSQHASIQLLLLSFLDDPAAPMSALNVVAHRADNSFLEMLLKKIGDEMTPNNKLNLRHIENIAWVRAGSEVLHGMDDAGQGAAVRLVLASGMKRTDSFAIVREMLSRGKPGGRRAAAAALREFKGADANSLVLASLHDDDPEVQASVLVQLRDRSIPGAMTKLIEMLDSPHGTVRAAARDCLHEFRFQRYLAAFDMLDEAVRASTGALVCKVDPDAMRLLGEEMKSLVRSRRMRAMEMTIAMRLQREMSPMLIELLTTDEDHFTRAAAARALAGSETLEAREALREALLDRSVMVQDAAERGLQEQLEATYAQPVSETESTEMPPLTDEELAEMSLEEMLDSRSSATEQPQTEDRA